MKYLIPIFLFLCLFPLPLFCQTGPGGVGNSTNNVLWLQADKGVFSDGGTTPAMPGEDVQQWNDQSGNSKNAIQDLAGHRPGYQSSVLNNLQALRFTAADADRLLSTTVPNGNAAAAWAVVQYSSLPPGKPGIIQGSPKGLAFNDNDPDKVIGLWVNNSNSRVGGQGVQFDLTVKGISETSTLSANTPYLLSSLYDGASEINQYVNGTAAGNVFYDGTLNDWSDFGIGAQGTQSWNGDIAEVIVYNSPLSSTQRILVDNYLAAKYNIPLSSNDYYTQDDAANGDYDFDVAGIGQLISSNPHAEAQGGMVRILNPMGLTINDTEFYIWGHDNAPAKASNTSDIPAAEGLEARFERVWRGSETGTIVNFDVWFDLSGLGPITASDLRLLIDTNNNGEFADETSIGGGIVGGATFISGNIYGFSTVTGLNNNIRFTLGTANKSQTTLPVELIKFDATTDGKKIKLSWTTASEKDNNFFTVERSLNGKSWEILSEISGAGNSSSKVHYLAWDYSPPPGLVYYRLRQTDFDGTSTYSNAEAVYFLPEQNIKIYPNPARNLLHIEWDSTENARISLLNCVGKVLNSNLLISAGSVTLHTSELTKGVYFLRVQFGSKTETHRILIN